MNHPRSLSSSVLAVCLAELLFPSMAHPEEGKDCANLTTPVAFIICAMSHDQRVLESTMEYEKAMAVQGAAGIWDNPVLDGEALLPPTNDEGYRTSFGLLQPLPISGGRGHAVRSAGHRVTAARIRLEAVRWQVAVEALIGLVRLRQVNDELRMLAEAGNLCGLAIERSGKLTFLTDEQEAARQAFVWRREAIRSRAGQLGNEALELKEKLALSIGGHAPLEWNELVPLRTEWSRWPAAASQSPTVVALKAEVEATEAEVQRARAAVWPEVAIGPFVESEPGSGPAGKPRSLGARISIALPVFDRNQGRISEAAAERNRAEATFAAEERALASRLKSLEYRYKTCVDRLLEYESSFSHGMDLIEKIKSRYMAGRVSASVVLEAIGSYQDAVEEAHGVEREAYATFWEGSYLSGVKEMPLP